MRRKVTIGTRGSKLALVQAGSLAAALRARYPDIEVVIRRIATAGDRDRRTPLEDMGVAVFVKELEEALLDGRIDLAAHSLKDMPADTPPGLRLLAVTGRADPRDALVAGARLMELPPGARIGTGSLRRSIQLAACRPDLKTCAIRGNVDTRLRKVDAGEVEGVIVAAAALIRLGWTDRITEYLPAEHFLPSVGQGALAVEARLDDEFMAELVVPLNDETVWRCVAAERAFLRALGGGCRAPIAALGRIEYQLLHLDGMVAGADGRRVLRARATGDPASPEAVGEGLARLMLESGAAGLVAAAGQP
ncbi:MAG: hydroxymethylbilane synthase [Chloroflexi bacterium]|nr:hydroxymethylbilane synthase [Chloroflexota bacterium]